MKYAISLLIGMLTGAFLLVLGVYHNPFAGKATVSPLAVTDDRVIDLAFSAVPSEGLLYTDHGESVVAPYPDRVAELWEPAVVDTSTSPIAARVYVTAACPSRWKVGPRS